VLSLAHLDAQPGAAAPAPPSPARARPGARRPPSRPRAPPARAGSPELRCATPDGGVNGKRGAAGAAFWASLGPAVCLVSCGPVDCQVRDRGDQPLAQRGALGMCVADTYMHACIVATAALRLALHHGSAGLPVRAALRPVPGRAAASGLSEGRRVRAAVLARGRAGRPRRAFADADSDASEPEVNRRRKHHNPWCGPPAYGQSLLCKQPAGVSRSQVVCKLGERAA